MSEDFNSSETLGTVLKNKRVALGRSIEQLSALTRIHAKTLVALEEDNFAELPARAFTRGFIVSYAKALGLNGDQLVKDHAVFLEQKFADRPSKDKGHEGYVFESKELEQNKRWLIIAASTAAFFAIVVLLIFKPQNHKRKEKHKDFTEEATLHGTATDEESGAEGLPEVAPNTASSATPAPAASAGTPVANTVAAAHTSPAAKPQAASLEGILPPSSPVSSSTPMGGLTLTTPAPKASEPPKPTATPKPSATPKASETPKASSTPAASPSPSASTSPAADLLNKGDDLSAADAKKKITLEALEDTWVKYQIDQKPANLLILRKGRFLVVKAKEKLTVSVPNAAGVRVKAKKDSSYKNLGLSAFQMGDDGAAAALEGGIKDGPALPTGTPPASPNSAPKNP